MKKPAKAKIGLYEYKISYESDVKLDDKDSYGVIHENNQTIIVNRDNSEIRQKETLLHECMHGIDYNIESGIKEKQIGALSNQLLIFMRDNKELVKYLIESD